MVATAVIYSLTSDDDASTHAWPPPPRPTLPLPAGSYDHVLPFTPPAGPDKLFYRGNFCGTRVPGVTILPEMAGYTVAPWNQNQRPFTPPLMALDFLRYFKLGMLDQLAEIFRVYVDVDGNTHLQVSIPHAIDLGYSKDALLAYCLFAKDRGVRYLDQWFLGGSCWHDRDRDAAFWKPIVEEWMLALKSSGLIDCCCVGWQLDQFNSGQPTAPGRVSPIQSIVDLFADWCGPAEIPLGTHWVNEAGVWNLYWRMREDRTMGWVFDRFQGWKDQRNKLTWFHHQGDVNMPIPEYQAKLKDTLDPFGNGEMGTSGLFGDRPFALTVYECSAQAQFDLYMTKEIADQRSFLFGCTVGASHVGGWGNGSNPLF